jgi:flagellar assembly protein FliH
MSTNTVPARDRSAGTGMLTKVLRGGGLTSAQPLLWRSHAGPAAGVSVQPAPLPSAAQPAQEAWLPRKPLPAGSDEGERLQLLARIAELEQSAERGIREAREAAFREGEAAGRNQAAAQIQPLLVKLARSLHEVAELRPKLRLEAESDLLQLALAIARKVLHRELSTDPEALAGLVKVALEKIRLRDIVRVRINPQYHAPVSQILGRLSPGTSIELLPDPKLELGGLIVETTRGEWDGSVATQLKEIERGLADRLLR